MIDWLKNQIKIFDWLGFSIIILFFLVLNKFKIFEEVSLMIEFFYAYFRAIAYLGLFFVSCVIIKLGLYSSRKIIFIPLFILCFVTSTVDLCYIFLNGTPIQVEDILLVSQNFNSQYIGQSWLQYSYVGFLSLGINGVFYGFIAWRRSIQSKVNNIQGLVYYLILFGLVFMIYKVTTPFLMAKNSFPSPIRIPTLSYYSLHNKLVESNRKPITQSPTNEPLFKHIVWIVDESIRGDILQVNGYAKNNTPFMSANLSKFKSLGVASSGAICSDYSHFILMNGLQLQDLPNQFAAARNKPFIYQYAKKAGFSANLIYSPSFDTIPMSYMTNSDVELLDDVHYLGFENPRAKAYDLDFIGIDVLKNIIDKSNYSFTYFLKYGAHFQYDAAYPSSSRKFKPTLNGLPRGDKEQLLNSYSNAISWTVDGFFSKLDTILFDKDVLVIYTSDHGQSLWEGKDFQATHCVKDKAIPQMANVPIILYSNDQKKLSHLLSQIPKNNVNRISHFHIFNTTLQLMGYKKNEVLQQYGRSIFDTLPKARFFTVGDIMGRSTMYLYKFE